MPIQNGCQDLNGISFQRPIPTWYTGSMPNARERARRRVQRWWEAQKDQGATQEKTGQRLNRSQPWVSKTLLTKGPRMEDLDRIAEMMGIPVEALVSKRDNAFTESAAELMNPGPSLSPAHVSSSENDAVSEEDLSMTEEQRRLATAAAAVAMLVLPEDFSHAIAFLTGLQQRRQRRQEGAAPPAVAEDGSTA